MRLIDADALKKQCIETDKWGKVILILDIANAPTIDAIEVVRCKDCKYRRENECPMYHEEWSVTEDGDDWLNTNDYTDYNGFCDWGERREP